MKKIVTLIVIFLIVFTGFSASARRSSQHSRLEEVKVKTEVAVDSLKSKAKNLNADSLATTVVITTRPDAEATMEVRNREDSDNVTRHQFSISDDDFQDILGVMFVLLFVMLFPAVIVLGCVFIIMRSKTKLKRQRYELIRHCVDAGTPLPKAFYQAEQPQPSSYLRSGIVWIGWGVGAIVLSAFGNESFFLAVGIVLIFIGLSRLAVYYRHMKAHECPDDNMTSDTFEDTTDGSTRC